MYALNDEVAIKVSMFSVPDHVKESEFKIIEKFDSLSGAQDAVDKWPLYEVTKGEEKFVLRNEKHMLHYLLSATVSESIQVKKLVPGIVQSQVQLTQQPREPLPSTVVLDTTGLEDAKVLTDILSSVKKTESMVALIRNTWVGENEYDGVIRRFEDISLPAQVVTEEESMDPNNLFN